MHIELLFPVVLFLWVLVTGFDLECRFFSDLFEALNFLSAAKELFNICFSLFSFIRNPWISKARWV